MQSVQSKIWQIAGMILIAGGLAIMVWGGWTFYQQQAELRNPPAPIREVAAMEEIGAPAPVSSLTPVDPTAIAPTDTPVVADKPVATPTGTPTLEPVPEVEEVEAEPEPLPRETESDPVESVAVLPTEELVVTPETVIETAVPSLADNPLVVMEDDISPSAETSAAPPADSTPASPLTRIVAESIGLDSPVIKTGWQQVAQDGVATNVWVVADYAAGWHQNSALPGEGGNIVLSGHHNIKGEVFRYIVDLEVGETVTLFTDDGQYDYVVNDKFIVKDKGEPESVRRANAKWIGPFNEERLTLVTCWPYNNNTHRVIVIAKPL